MLTNAPCNNDSKASDSFSFRPAMSRQRGSGSSSRYIDKETLFKLTSHQEVLRAELRELIQCMDPTVVKQ